MTPDVRSGFWFISRKKMSGPTLEVTLTDGFDCKSATESGEISVAISMSPAVNVSFCVAAVGMLR